MEDLGGGVRQKRGRDRAHDGGGAMASIVTDIAGRVVSTISAVGSFYTEINPSTLSGAIDVVVIEHNEGELFCSPFHVRFGKLQLLRPSEKVVEVSVNGVVTDLAMKVGEAGEAFFIVEADNPVPSEYATSPIAEPASPPQEPFALFALDGDVRPVSPIPHVITGAADGIASTNIAAVADAVATLALSPEETMSSADDDGGLVPSIASNTSSNNVVSSPPLSTLHTQATMATVPVAIGKLTAAPDLTVNSGSVATFPRNAPSSIGIPVPSRPGGYAASDFGTSGPSALARSPHTESDFDYEHGKSMSTSPTQGYSWLWGRFPERQKRDDAHPPSKHIAVGSQDTTQQQPIVKQSQLSVHWEKDGGQAPVTEPEKTVESRIQIDPPNEYIRSSSSSPIPKITHPANSTVETGTVVPTVTHTTTDPWPQSQPQPPVDHNTADTSADSMMDDKLSKELMSMSVAEKVDHYLASLPQTDSSSSQAPSAHAYGPATTDTGTAGSAAFVQRPAASRSLSPDSSVKAAEESLFAALSGSIADPNQNRWPGGLPKMEMSLCGNLLRTMRDASPEELDAAFKAHLVSYEQFCENPAVLNNPALVVLVQNHYLSWSSVMPIVTAHAAFGKPLTEESIRRLFGFSKISDASGSDATEIGGSAATLAPSAASLAVQPDAPKYSFGQNLRSWWGRGSPTLAVPTVAGGVPTSSATPVPQTDKKLPVAVPGADASSPSSNGSKNQSSPPATTTAAAAMAAAVRTAQSKYRYAKSLRLNSDQLKSLNLKNGINTISFSVTTKLQGRATCAANLFLWNQNDKVVISDVDGTITKSDVLGHMFTMVGRDWTHAGVASLYTNIQRNGYKFLYLTSRAIGQAKFTRDYLKKVEQDRHQLPEGPVIMSPDRLLRAFHREVILRKPEEFKIACLRDIKKLFGERSPFYGGFGNRITDALSYRSVDVPPSRIFTVNPSGDVKLELMATFKSSYVKLNDVVDQMFPPVDRSLEDEYTDLNYWRTDLPEIKIDIPGKAGVVGASPTGAVNASLMSTAGGAGVGAMAVSVATNAEPILSDAGSSDEYDEYDDEEDDDEYSEAEEDLGDAGPLEQGSAVPIPVPSALGDAPSASGNAGLQEAVDMDGLLEEQENERMAAIEQTPYM